MKESIQKYVDWTEVNHLCNVIANNVVKPDLIIGIATGAMIPTSIVARKLNIFNVEFIGLKSYTKEKTQNSIQLYHKPDLEFASDKKILVIDDLLDSGNSFNYVNNYLLSLGLLQSNIQYAVMHYKIKDEKQYKPLNFVYGTQCAGDVWLAYPWE